MDNLVFFDKLNSSYNNKITTCKGIVKELSSEFKDHTYAFIQLITIQNLKKGNQAIGFHQDKEIILLDDNIGLLSVGDYIQVTGVVEV